MDTDDIWTALAINGHVRLPIAAILPTTNDRWFRNQLNSEAAREGVSLRINSIMKGDYCLGLNIYLRKMGNALDD